MPELEGDTPMTASRLAWFDRAADYKTLIVEGIKRLFEIGPEEDFRVGLRDVGRCVPDGHRVRA
jgi:hypothetical protein